MDDTVKIAGWFLADENKAFTENIIFSNIPFQTGKYPLETTDDDQVPSSHFSTLLGRDVPNSRFNLDTASGNFIEVEIADSESNYISGTFEAVYIRDHRDDTVYNFYLPDTLRFANGFFRVKVEPPR